MTLKKSINNTIKEFSLFGSLPFYVFIVLFLFILGYRVLSIKLILGLIFSYFLVFLIRWIYFKDRPKKEKYNNFLEKIDASSFPSLHSMRAVVLSGLISLKLVSLNTLILFGFMMLCVFLSRWHIKKHYLADILFGAVFGLLIVLSISYLL